MSIGSVSPPSPHGRARQPLRNIGFCRLQAQHLLFLHKAAPSRSHTGWSSEATSSTVVMDRLLLMLFITLAVLAQVLIVSPFMATSDADREILADYPDVTRYLYYNRKRSCIKRGGSCDHRPNDCCYNSSCRCNLWGTNCRCQRMGLFQKWGK